jgi:hypothetical protein
VQQPHIGDVVGVETGLGEGDGERGREVGIQQESDAGRASGTSRSLTIAAAYSRAASTSARSR